MAPATPACSGLRALPKPERRILRRTARAEIFTIEGELGEWYHTGVGRSPSASGTPLGASGDSRTNPVPMRESESYHAARPALTRGPSAGPQGETIRNADRPQRRAGAASRPEGAT